MLHPRAAGIAVCFHSQCNCTATQFEVNVSPEIIYTEGLSVSHFGFLGDATLLELAVSLTFSHGTRTH